MSKTVKIIIVVVSLILLGIGIYVFVKKNKKAAAKVATPGIIPNASEPSANTTNTVADPSNGLDADHQYIPPPSATILPMITPSSTGVLATPVSNTTVSSVATAPAVTTSYSTPVADPAPSVVSSDPVASETVNTGTRTTSTI